MTSADQSELKLLRCLIRDTTTVSIRLLFFHLLPPDHPKRIPSQHSEPDLKAKLKGAPMTSLPYSDKCDRERSIQLSLQTVRIKSQTDAEVKEATSCRATYDMKYVHGSRKEHQLDVDVLTRNDMIDTGQRRPQQNKIAARTGKELFHH